MPRKFTENVFSSTYKEDFKDSDNYHRILFNSGRAIQARELTQSQTIIQEEIGRFGRNIFKDGASVNPGGPTINTNYEFVKLNTNTNALPAGANALEANGGLIGVEFTGANSNVVARVLEVVEAEGSDPATLYVQYVNTSGGEVGENPVRYKSGETISGGGETLTVQSTNTASNPAIGRGCQISNSSGDFFVRGHFVFAKEQSLILSKYSRLPSKVIGFKVTEDIVTTSDTNELFDNQGATPNLSSPGADRYRIQLTLTTKDQVASDENFVYYCDVVDGNIVDQVSGTDDYNKITEVLAQRTAEESGNYIVSPFTIDFADDATNNTNFIASVSSGVAYLNGYRVGSEKPTKLTIPKPRAEVERTNEVVGVNYGQYFICDVLEGNLNINQFQTVGLKDATGFGGNGLGTARVRYVEEDGSNFKIYLFDINLLLGKVLRDVKSFGTGTADFAQPLLENGKAVIKESNKVNLVFPTPDPRPKSITDVDFEVQRVFTGTSDDGTIVHSSSIPTNNASGTVQLTLSATGETFANTGQFIATVDSSGDVVSSLTIGAAGTQSVNVSGLPIGSAVTVYAKVNKAQPSVRTKTLVETTKTFTGISEDSNGSKYIDLHENDIFEIVSIKDTDSNGADQSSKYYLDNGQRAGFYNNGRLILNGGATAPGGSDNTFIRFKHFTHGAGDFFSVNSYTGQVDYEDIPSFATGPRESVNLRDVIDFRSSVDSDGLFVGGDAAVNEMPTNGDIFQGDVTYYMPRADKVVITKDGELKNIQGENGFGSQVPDTPENTLGLFELELNAYGLHDSDVATNVLRAKRFTMADIGKLEKRVDKLEEVTSLSLLEVGTDALLVLDSAGNPRTKSGFFVDNFADRTFSDVQSPEYRAGIDPSTETLSPQKTEKNVTLRYDSAASSNTILKGDTVYLKYQDVEAITQTQVSGTENVNPFAVITGEGELTLSPASDEWIDTEYRPANVINKTATETLAAVNEGNLAVGTAASRGLIAFWWGRAFWIPLLGFGLIPNAGIWNGWNGVANWNRNGVVQGSVVRRGRNIVRSFSQRIVVGERTVRKEIGDRTVSLTFLPFIRARKIFFHAEGLRPNTQYFAFFDGTPVADYVRTETSFERFASSTNGGWKYGDRHKLAAEHPEGKSTLTSDLNGAIRGSFFIPAREDLRFKAGEREFKLLDISVNNDANALSIASAIYTAQGTLDTRQKTITSTRITTVRTRRWTETQRVRGRDPLAQSFRVTEPDGIFVTKVQTYFKSKDDVIPIRLEIRPMVNGQPSATDIIANAVKFLTPSSEVSLPASQTQAAVVAAPTTFTFDEPVFLNPDTEYAIVLLAESTKYEAYVGETYAFELGSTENRISRQPSMGSLFKSQNGTTWEPDQTKDLAFKIFKADFSTAGGFAVFENVDMPKQLLKENPFHVENGDATVTAMIDGHGFQVGDDIHIEGIDSADTVNGITGANIVATRAITHADGYGIKFEAGANATSSGRFGGTNVAVDQQIQFDEVIPMFTTLTPDNTNLTYSAKFTTGKSWAGSETRFQKDTSFNSDIAILDTNLFDSPRLIATPQNETTELGAGVRSTTFKVDMTTNRADVSPIIDAQRASLICVGNQIDRQANSVSSGFNVPLSFTAETEAFGGSSLAKHTTSVQTLAESAVGLKVLLAALRPSASDFDLYYRVARDGTDIFQEDFILQGRETAVAPDGENFREYRYLIGKQGGDIAPFTQYQLKIVMTSTNSSLVPIFKDLRVIAMAV